MAQRFWVPGGGSGSGTWDHTTTTNWSATSGGAGGASVPTSDDDVFFDANSITAGSQTVDIGGSGVDLACRNIDFTGVLNTPTLDWVGTDDTLAVYGDFTLGTNDVVFAQTGSGGGIAMTGGATHELDTGGTTFGLIDLYLDGGTVNLRNSFNGSVITDIAATTFNTNGYDIDVVDLFDFDNSGSILNGSSSTIYAQDADLDGALATFNITNTTFFIYTEFSGLFADNIVMGTVHIYTGLAGNAVLDGNNVSIKELNVILTTATTKDKLEITASNIYIGQLNQADDTEVYIIGSDVGVENYYMNGGNAELLIQDNMAIGNLYVLEGPTITFSANKSLTVDNIQRNDQNSNVITFTCASSDGAYIQLLRKSIELVNADFTNITASGEGFIYTDGGSISGTKSIIASAQQAHYGAKRVEVVIYTADGTSFIIDDGFIKDYLITNSTDSPPGPMDFTIKRNINDFDQSTYLVFDNRVNFYVIDRQSPTKELVYTGKIKEVVTDYDNDEFRVLLYNDGADLSEHIYRKNDTLDVDNSAGGVNGLYEAAAGETFRVIDSFTTGGSVTDVSSISAKLDPYIEYATGNLVATMKLFSTLVDAQDVNADASLASVSKTIPRVNPGFTKFKFVEPAAVASSTVYYVRIDIYTPAAADIVIQYESSGSSFYYSSSTWASFAHDISLKTFTNTEDTSITQTNADVADVIKDIINSSSAQGGFVSYNTLSVKPTGILMTYDFNAQLCDKAIQKAMGFLDSSYYSYVDHATNLFYLGQYNDDQDFAVTKGHEIVSLSSERSAEDVKTVVYFKGGDTGSGFLYKKYIDTNAIDAYGVRVLQLSDGRVTLEASADDYVEKRFDGQTVPTNRTMLTIVDDNGLFDGYDIEKVRLGQTVRVNGYDDGKIPRFDQALFDDAVFDYDLYKIGSFLHKIVRLSLKRDTISLVLNAQPALINKAIANTYNALIDSELDDTPDTPLT
jgi:hypothetical protein